MAETTHISWSGATWNAWQGCRRKSEGCRFCYMFRDKKRYGQDPTLIHRSSPATFRLPIKLQREAEAGKRTGAARMVFTCSWSDWFIKEADAWRDDAWAIIRECPDLIFQILTKRPERMADHLPNYWGEIRDRCWLGASAEDQKNYDLRRPYIDSDLSPVMWWSLEPLLGPIAMGFGEYASKPAWVVTGGESGPEARPMNTNWARAVRDECEAAGVPFRHNQNGAWIGGDQVAASGNGVAGVTWHEWPDGGACVRFDAKRSGRYLDGAIHDAFPMPREAVAR